MPTELQSYTSLLLDIKKRISIAQGKVANSISSELTEMYWDIGYMIHERQQKEGWGSGIIPKLAKDIVNDYPEIKGFSVRNLKRMLRFYREYSKVPQPVALLPWSHNILLIERIKDVNERLWYANQIIKQGWNRDNLTQMIKNKSYQRHGGAITNLD
jgi:predicted nuclease of restriction endonuclease-like (RecB) superfamily